ncbi:MAG: hypothetical protein BWZ03_00474 [bacterium ADurb.BinA186]|nr:MAG: hypothetical protein BWZ03_00474 [bacterium ADurb.BinA186]
MPSLRQPEYLHAQSNEHDNSNPCLDEYKWQLYRRSFELKVQAYTISIIDFDRHYDFFYLVFSPYSYPETS